MIRRERFGHRSSILNLGLGCKYQVTTHTIETHRWTAAIDGRSPATPTAAGEFVGQITQEMAADGATAGFYALLRGQT